MFLKEKMKSGNASDDEDRQKALESKQEKYYEEPILETHSQLSDSDNEHKPFNSGRPSIAVDRLSNTLGTPRNETQDVQSKMGDEYDLKAMASFTASELWVLQGAAQAQQRNSIGKRRPSDMLMSPQRFPSIKEVPEVPGTILKGVSNKVHPVGGDDIESSYNSKKALINGAKSSSKITKKDADEDVMPDSDDGTNEGRKTGSDATFKKASTVADVRNGAKANLIDAIDIFDMKLRGMLADEENNFDSPARK